MNALKNRLVVLTVIFLAVSFLIFLVTGYIALYWAWARGNLDVARPYLPWARNFGMLAIAGAAMALGILFSSKTFPVAPRVRFSLSLLATVTIAFFSEFRNEGKFYFKNLHHFFGRETWIHKGLNGAIPSLGDFMYRMEYSHWNDFLLGPAVVSVLFPLAIVRIYKAFQDTSHISLSAQRSDTWTDLDQALRFARILMNVGLFWFFWQSWAEKAGYLSNPHSTDEIDLPFELGGTMLGFWTARVLTKPFGQQSEKFRSTFFIDFLSSGVMGLLYTLIVGPLVEAVGRTVGHALYPVIPHSMEVHEYTELQRHLRPLELLLVAGGTWWSLNRSSRTVEITRLSGTYEDPVAASRWTLLKTMAKVLGVVTAYLVTLAIMFWLLEPEGLRWTLATAGTGLAAGTVAFLVVKRVAQRGFTRLLGKDQFGGSFRG